MEMKFQKPSKIQAISLPMILSSPFKDLIAQAHNGSGKTTCFVLGMLSRVDPKLLAPQALCVCPTRELAIQVKFCPFLRSEFVSSLRASIENQVMLLAECYKNWFLKETKEVQKCTVIGKYLNVIFCILNFKFQQTKKNLL